MTVDTFFDDWRDVGHELLAGTIRHELRERAADLGALSDHIDEIDLFDPWLFAQLIARAPDLDLQQCVWGLLPPSARPARAMVCSFADGRVLLPGVGLLAGARPNATFELTTVDGQPTLVGEHEIVLERFPTIAPGAKVVVYPHAHPPLRPFLVRHGDHFEQVQLAEATAGNAAAIADGWSLIARVWPRLLDELERDLRMVVMVQHPKVISMAIAAMHGAVFLNTRGPESPLFFVEEFVHQAGHVTFTKIIADWQAFMAIPDKTPMTALNGRADDTRSFSDAFHGNYTITRMAQTLARLLDVDLGPTLGLELRGRLTLTMTRLEAGLRELDHEGLYTDAGWALHRRLHEAWTQLHATLGRLEQDWDVRNQPYVFDAQLFAATNSVQR